VSSASSVAAMQVSVVILVLGLGCRVVRLAHTLHHVQPWSTQQ
jgi:hypothetical protein